MALKQAKTRSGFRFLEGITQADVAFEATGKSLADLCENAGLATETVMAELSTIKPRLKHTVKLQASDQEQLVFKFLDELVYLKDAEQLLFSKIKATVVEGKAFKLVGLLQGDKINVAKQRLGTDVKAVTMHQFKVEKAAKGWRAIVVLDI
ncbi:archease [Candidatus Woesearchaeota archaeon]|nr:archease [Candidatus Woesearchaeota archaeon]